MAQLNATTDGLNTKKQHCRVLDRILDGVPDGEFVHSPGAQSCELEYNVLVFSRQELSNENHMLQIETAIGVTAKFI